MLTGAQLSNTNSAGHYHTGYVFGVASAAALGGLLFGYDWVVIGGAKPFYEVYFQLQSPRLIGWANSCALLGCLIGALIAGKAGSRFGRKKVLLASAVLFAVSSVLTGWAHLFDEFIFWRIMGGVAIGLASHISPLYIAEVSPAPWRGRLVSLNQLALVCGILAAQIADWLIAGKLPAGSQSIISLQSWNAQFAWRWMFTAVTVPSLIFFVLAVFIPESPRWLASRENLPEAERVLIQIGGDAYAKSEVAAIRASLEAEKGSAAAWREFCSGKMRKLLLIGIALAVLQQWSGINILFNYAEEIYRSAGFGISGIMFDIVITGAINLLFTLIALAFVDRIGRRSLMLLGCVGVGVSHLAAGFAYRAGWKGSGALILTLCAIACYAMSLAPITWVLISEIFPNRVRSFGVSVAVGTLWMASFSLTYTFPLINTAFGTSGAFFLYGAICLLGSVFVYWFVPETKGKTLEQIEILTEQGS